MSGSISFNSTYGQGTIFTFCIKDSKICNFPLRESSMESLNFPTKEDKISPIPDSFINLKLTPIKNCVLVVDDEMICGHIVKSYCKSLGIVAEVVLFFLVIFVGIFRDSSS